MNNMRRISAILLALMLVLSLPAFAFADSAPHYDELNYLNGQLRVGMECAYAPNNWQESEASDTNVPIENVPGAYAEGYDVQWARIIADYLGLELVIVKMDWDGLIPALNEGQIDAIVVNVENAPAYMAANPNFVLITFAEGDGFELPAKGSCVGIRYDDNDLVALVNEALAGVEQAQRDEMRIMELGNIDAQV